VIARRLHAFVRTWPRWQAHAFAKYRHAAGFAGRRFREDHSIARDGLFWWSLPGWLFDSFTSRKNKRSVPPGLFDDVMWGQYCLFLFLRIQDDTCDGSTKERSLLYTGNEFLLEAERAFAKHFDRLSPFWRFYRKRLQQTFRAGVEIERLQQNSRTNPSELIRAYANVGHAFAVAPAALCTLLGPDKTTRRVLKFTEEMTVAGQIMDDLEDIHEDLKRDRYNYCTLVLMQHTTKSRAKGGNIHTQIYEGLLRTGALNEIFDSVRLHLSRAQKNIAPLQLSAAEALIHDYRTGLDFLSDAIHHRRVDILLGRFRH
jgi:hypothetical protein